MAESKFVLMNVGESAGAGFGSVSLSTAALNAGVGQLAVEQTNSLRQVLLTVSGKIVLLTTAIDALSVTLTALRALPQAASAGAKSESGGGQKTPEKSSAGAEPPETRKAAMAMDSAAATLANVAQLSRDDGKDMALTSLKMASATLVAAGGTTGVELVRIETLAAKAGIGSEAVNAEGKKRELLTFASDAAITASAFKVTGLEAGEMLKVWRTSMKLSRNQALDLADAANHLGKMPGDVQAADIGSVLQQSGEAAISAGLQPEQAAALTAALLNSGAKKDDAGNALKNISDALGKGDQASMAEKGAWKQLGLDPKTLAEATRDPDKQNAQGAVLSVLAALNTRPVEQRSTLARTLFADSGDTALSLSQDLGKVNEAFYLVSDKSRYATSKLGDKSSVRQSALALAETQQGQWNIKNAREERLSVAKGNALAPDIEKTGESHSLDTLSDLAETYPKTTGAVLTATAWIKPVFDAVTDAVVGELKDRGGKWIVDKAASYLPGRSKLGLSAATSATAVAETQGLALASRSASAGNGLKILEQTARVAVPRLEPALASVQPASRWMPWQAKAAMGASAVAAGIASGDKQQISKGLGEAGGAWAGAVAGSSIGASIGSVGLAPGIALGGLIGGLVGGWLGAEGGGFLGERLMSTAPDKLAPPAEVAKDLSGAQTQNQQVSFAPTIQVSCPAPDTAQQIQSIIEQQLSGQFHGQFIPLLTGNPLGTRRDAALTDGAGT
ncbi:MULTISPECIES: phage tail tape measure protein [unclassified Pseudomonas]|uniref:phage tail tape measure protein n=1 Tax=unclassified Pseudomonas TaxID=196821 RepID=UPI000A1E05D3|nr:MULTISPECIES: phage tail tape measure protein [unclassified Pseudomonas]